MNYRKLISITFITIFISGFTGNRTHMGDRVEEVPFQLASGEVVYLPVTKAGRPVPAENDSFKIEVAGIQIPGKEPGKKLSMIWSFMLTSKKPVELEYVHIDQVFPGNTSIRILNDEEPSLNESVWFGNQEPVLINKTFTPWLYEDGISIFIFKITIKVNSQAPTVLYQPSMIPESAKIDIQYLMEH